MLRKLSFCLLSFVALAALFGGGAGGCNTDEVAGHGDDDDVVGTEQDAKDTAIAAENIAFRSFTASFGSPSEAVDALGSPGALVTQERSNLILEKLKSVITATTRSSCPGGTVVSPGGGDVTVNGSVSGF
ncbi:MAG TPA: hypothetical protein VFX30_12205, partial [bacterium]|nr:hypothetical protein [bacterium]